MKTLSGLKSLLAAVGCLALLSCCGGAQGQAVPVNPGYKALVRPIHYSMPLAPKDGPHALIVYGKNAPWTQKAAQALQKAVADWCGVKLELVDDQTVTNEDTWLLNDAYRKTPLIVLGNAQDNRVMHAMGVHFLLQSNRYWPGGDRYFIRSVFEPFVADVNYVSLEASTQAGMDGAVAKLGDLLKTFGDGAKAAATLPPRMYTTGSVKDKWESRGGGWTARPPEWATMGDRGVAELIAAFKGRPYFAGSRAGDAGVTGDSWYHMMGGLNLWGQQVQSMEIDLGSQKAIAAMILMGCRAVGGRTHGYYDHYGALGSLLGIQGVLNSAILNPQEVAELESCIVLSCTLPLDYNYNNVGGDIGGSWGGRHNLACVLFQLHALDYAVNHCRMDEMTRKEVDLRYDAARRSTVRYVRSFRDNDESDCLGENTLMQVSCLLHEGLMDNIRNGRLRQSADMYITSVDNLPGPCGAHGNYVGLDGFSNGRGGMFGSFFGGGLVDEAAFYYDDPMYRWLGRKWADIKWSRGGGYMWIHNETVGEVVKPEVPTSYDGVRALPFDGRLYAVLKDPRYHCGGPEDVRQAPEPFEKAADRVAFRDGFDAQMAYLFLATSQPSYVSAYVQNNSIARFTDLGDLWLFTNTESPTGWSRNLMSISNGKPYIPHAACTVEALSNVGEVSAVSSKEEGIAGTDWTRTIVHWRGHYFVVMDRMQARQDDEYSYVCRWRTTQFATLQKGAWLATAPDGNTMRIQNTEPVFQTSEYWECDGAARPYVLQQYKQAKLAKGQIQTCQNLIYVSGASRPDEFEARRVGPNTMLVKGRTGPDAKAGTHLALIGTLEGQVIPWFGFETDAAIYDVAGEKLYLAGATTLKIKIGGELQDILWAPQPVNVMVDCRSGKGEIEVRGDHPLYVKTGATWGNRKPGRQAAVFAQADTLPKLSGLLETIWSQYKAPADIAVPETARGERVFEEKPASTKFNRPLRRLTNAGMTATPPWGLDTGRFAWPNTDNLEITLSLPQSTPLGCLRLVGIMKRAESVAGRKDTQGIWGSMGKYYQEGDFKFSLVLSDDGFKKDIRKIDTPQVHFEETIEFASMHSGMDRLPTWRIEIGQKARQVKLLPRATTKERARLVMRDLELYEAQSVNELTAKAIVADINGDGANELLVGTSQKELAAFDADGNRLWHKDCPGDIIKLEAADLDESGKSQAIVMLGTERLLRIDADGAERPGGDLYKAQVEAYNGCAGATGVISLSVWGPDDPKKKEVVLHSCGPFRVLADGSMKLLKCMGFAQASARLVNMYPAEREVLATVDSQGTSLWSSRRDSEGSYVRLGSVGVPGFDGGERGGFGYVRPIDVSPFKGCVTAIPSGINYFPITAFVPGAKEKGWSFSTGGVPAVAALVEDITGDGVPEVFLARKDGFVNILKLADGSSLGLLNLGEPILGMAMLKGKDGNPRLAVGTKFGVRLFAVDPATTGMKEVGRSVLPVPAAAFAGPGGKNKDRVFVVDSAGTVTVLSLK